jgi:predicted RNA-binding Zn-ribbon protein involved in translation (DUF1610 family)
MKTVIREDSSVYESAVNFKCPQCGEEEDIKVDEISQLGPLYRDGIRFMVDCRSCWYFGSSDGKLVARGKEKDKR